MTSIVKTIGRIACVVVVVFTSNAIAAWPMRFGDGTTIEVGAMTQDGAKWWSPDGSAASDPGFRSRENVSVDAQGDAKPLEVVLTLDAASDLKGKSLVVRAGPKFDQGLFKTWDANGRMVRVHVPAPADSKTLSLRFGVASGTWTETVLWERDKEVAPPPPTTQPAATSPPRFLSLEEDHGQALVRLQNDPPARGRGGPRLPITGGGGSNAVMGGGSSGGGNSGQIRCKGNRAPGEPPMIQELLSADSAHDQQIAIYSNGRKLLPSGFERSGDGQLTLRFRCPMAQVEKVVCASRGYEWQEMKNISLTPGAGPTKVEVTPVSDIKETTPSTDTPPPRG